MSLDDWYDEDWQHRVVVIINHTKVASREDLLNFPLYFTTEQTAFKTAQESGADFLFTASDGRTKLSHEIRFWIARPVGS